MATVEMSFTPLPVHVRTARLVATAVARRSGVEEALLDEVRLAVGEACSRAVEARFEVVVTDAAEAGQDDGTSSSAEPAGWPVPGSGGSNGSGPPDHSVPPEGLGLAVIAGLADDVQFARTPAGLSIKMSWPSAATG
jgi:serine/threonine-protein kinase RsbW